MRARLMALVSTAVVLLAIMDGCGSNLGLPTLGKVNGKVTYNGRPVTSGTVTFTPLKGTGSESGHVATSPIESDASYTLTTFNTGDGAVLGQHAVTVTFREAGADLKTLNLNQGADPNKTATLKPKYVMPKLASPPKYASPSTSPLKYTVKEGQNTFDLELKD